MKKLTVGLLKTITDDLKEHLIGSFITNIVVVSLNDFVLSFSFYHKEKLLISLNHNNPFLSLANIDENFHTILGNLNDNLRSKIKDAYIIDITQKENDRIAYFTLTKQNELFEKETFYLVLELIPHRANLLLLDENKKVLFATHYTSLDAKRVVTKGMAYEELESNNQLNEEESYDIEEIKKEASLYLDEVKSSRRKDRFNLLFTKVKGKIKSLNRKLEILKAASLKAESELTYKDYGDIALSLIYTPDLLNDYLNDEVLKDYDESLTPKENAERYYKKYKKAKSTLLHNEEETKKALEEIDYYNHLLTQLENGDDEDLEELKLLILGEDKTPKGRKSKGPKISPSCITYNGTRIGFGKTDEQNEILTFKKSQPNYTFIHVEHHHGAHVVIMKDNPSNEEIELASMIALHLSKLSDGNIQVALIRDVKKGNSKGLVNLKKYHTVYITHIRDDIRDILSQAKRFNQ